MNISESRDIASLQANQVSVLVRLEKIEEKMDVLMTQVAVARGGLRVLVWLGAVAAAISAFFGWIIDHLLSSK